MYYEIDIEKLATPVTLEKGKEGFRRKGRGRPKLKKVRISLFLNKNVREDLEKWACKEGFSQSKFCEIGIEKLIAELKTKR